MRVLAVPAALADEAIRRLHARGLLDGARATRREGARVLVPVRDAPGLAEEADALGAVFVDGASLPARDGRVTPHARVLARLAEAVPEEARALVPDKWEKLGDVVVVRLPDALEPYAREVGAAFAEALDAKTVLQDARGVAGELREMDARFLHGDDPVAEYVEDGIRYRLDASRIMLSSGNEAERMRAGRLDARGETVVDMFAGIGYFALPLAKRAGPARVHAIEKNPVSYRYLCENVVRNGVGHVVVPWHGDNREFPYRGIADRVLMGYVGGTRTFLPTAFGLLKPEGGVVHLHDTAHAASWRDELTAALLAAARACGTAVRVEEARVVKSYAPGVVHAVVTAHVRR